MISSTDYWNQSGAEQINARVFNKKSDHPGPCIYLWKLAAAMI